jgi:hypothetical protein
MLSYALATSRYAHRTRLLERNRLLGDHMFHDRVEHLLMRSAGISLARWSRPSTMVYSAHRPPLKGIPAQ